jgi:uncharacterized membrane protein YfcA
MKLKSKMLRIILFIVVCLISILVSGIISQEGGPIWLGAVFIFVGYKLIFKNKKTYEKTIAKQAEQKEPKKTNNNKIENGKTFQKKHLLFIGLSIGVIIFLLAFGKYNNQTKSTSLKSLDNNFIRLDTKTFLEEAISEKNYTVIHVAVITRSEERTTK